VPWLIVELFRLGKFQPKSLAEIPTFIKCQVVSGNLSIEVDYKSVTTSTCPIYALHL
jgi:hypothetical protein